jgi:hypothetical protein
LGFGWPSVEISWSGNEFRFPSTALSAGTGKDRVLEIASRQSTLEACGPREGHRSRGGNIDVLAKESDAGPLGGDACPAASR